MKVATILGTRPEIIKLSRVIAALKQNTEHVLIHTGQNYDEQLNEVFFRELEISRPDYYLEAAAKSPAQTVANVIHASSEVLAKVMPDAVLILGDTNSCLAALSAKRLKIPVFHMEAGNRCFDERVPEEINRRIVDHISDINLPYTTIARDYLLREGIPPDRIIKTGSPMLEVLSHYRKSIDQSDVLGRLGLKQRQYFVVSVHREENVDSERQFARFGSILESIAEKYDLPVIMSVHPRTRQRIGELGIRFSEKIRMLNAMGLFDYVHLMVNAKATLSDSGTITEESSILNFPALNLREAHERPEGMEEASVIMTGMDPELVLDALRVVENQGREGRRTLGLVRDYQVPNVSEKVLRIILSYTKFVRRVVWHEE